MLQLQLVKMKYRLLVFIFIFTSAFSGLSAAAPDAHRQLPAEEPGTAGLSEPGESDAGYAAARISAGIPSAEKNIRIVVISAISAILVSVLSFSVILRMKQMQSSGRYRSLFLQAPIALMEMKKNGEIVQVNEAFTDRLGYTIDDMRDLDEWYALVFPDEEIRDREKTAVRSGLSAEYKFDKAVEHGEFTLRCRNGTEKVFIIGANEAYGEYILSFIDIDEQKKMAAEIEKTRDLFYTLFELAPFSCVINRFDGGIIDANQHFCNRVGRSKTELIGMTNHGLGRAVDAAFEKQIMEQLASEGYCRVEEAEIPLSTGSEWTLFASRVIDWADEKAILSVSIDITQKKKTEMELKKHRDNLEQLVYERTAALEEAVEARREKEARLIQAEKMASLGVLTAGVAHEINNPLNFLMGAYVNFKNYFNAKESGNAEIELLLEGMRTGIDRTAAIVRMLNQFSMEAGSSGEKCSIGDILDNCLLVLQRDFEGRISVSKIYPEDPVVVTGNSGKLHQAFLSVLRNAAQAIDDNGLIEIKFYRAGDKAEIYISDDGCGIPEDEIPRIIEPFYTIGAGREGTGLGLALCYNIIQEHRGRLEFDSKPGEGTSVHIVIEGRFDGE